MKVFSWADPDGDRADLTTMDLTSLGADHPPLCLEVTHTRTDDGDDGEETTQSAAVYISREQAHLLLEALKPYALDPTPPRTPEEIDQWLTT